MGMFGGIVAGAMGGLGGAMEKQGEIAQQQQGQYNNMADLAQLNAQLDVQKQASLMRLQQEIRLNALSDPRFQASQPAQSTQPIPVPAGVASSTNNSSPQSKVMPIALPSGSMASLNVGDLPADPSGGTNQLGWANLSQMYKDQLPQNNATRAGVVGNEVAMNTDPALTPILNNEAARTGSATAAPSVNYPVPPAASASHPAYTYNPTTGTMEPSMDLLRGQMRASIVGGDAGVSDYLKNNQLSDAEMLSAKIQRAGANTPAGQALQKQLDNIGYIAPVNVRSNYIDSKGVLHVMPAPAPAGFVNQHNEDGSWSVTKMQGGTDAVAVEQQSKDAGAAAQKTWEAQKAAAAQVPGTLARIETMERLLPQFTSGNGAQDMANWKSWAATHGIPVDASATNAAQEFKKYSSQLLAEQRAGMGGSATDAAQDMAEAGSANIGLGNDVNKNVLAFMRANAIGTLNFQKAKQAFINQNGGTITPNQASNFDSEYNQNYDPQVILYSHMQPGQKQQFISDITKNGQYDNFEKKLVGYTSLMNQYK